MKMKILLISCLVVLLMACQEEPQPKPDGFLALEYPKPEYQKIDLDCPFVFEKNKYAQIETGKSSQNCAFNLNYPNMRAMIYITYRPVENNLRELLIDAQKLPEKHTIKADGIEANIYENFEKKTFGNFYEVEGDAASQAQFYLTDSTNHFLTGSIYFKARPNYDSILPAADYVKKDIRQMMESVEWKSKD